MYPKGSVIAMMTGAKTAATKHRRRLAREAKMAKRTCLRCGEVFPSRGPAHRLCPYCRDRVNYWDSTMSPMYTKRKPAPDELAGRITVYEPVEV